MKTDNTNTGVPVWANNVEILTQEECLPVIGNCQVSSIFQTLGPNETDNTQQNIDLIILPPNDLKLPLDNSFTLENNYIILNEKNDKKVSKQQILNNERSDDGSKKKKDNFEDLLYFVCNLCPFLCTKDTKITEHLENAHKNKNVIKQPQLKCPACANIFYHKLSLRSHLIHDHGVGNSDLSQIIQAVIYYSNKKSKENKNLEKKLQKPVEITKLELAQDNNNENILDSEISTESFEGLSQKQDVNVPLLLQADSVQTNSEKLMNTLRKTSETVSKQSDSKKYKCVIPTCNVKLQDLDKLNYHVKCHTENGFECKDCQEKFLFWKPLSSHLWRFHKIDMDLFSCDKCDYKTYSLAKLNNIHKLIHGDIKNFICSFCNKAFKNCKQLRNHKNTHKDKTEKNAHICEVCSKSFADKRQLRVHMDVVHKKIRPFLCNYCGYKGSSRSSLKMHIRQHTGEKPFSCNFCSYTTSDHNSLRRHNLRHTGQKPYKCSYCSYACIQSSTYKTHLKTKHPGMEKDLMFTCQECQFRSVNKDMYILHMVNMHKVKPHMENTEVS